MDANDNIPKSGQNAPSKTINRREFIGGMAAASAFTILPRRVLGGVGFVPPCDRLNVAQFGCGAQGIREVSTGLAGRGGLQSAAACEPDTGRPSDVEHPPP